MSNAGNKSDKSEWCRSDSNGSMSSGASPQGLGQLLDAFDRAWAAYLQRFVAWKFADAAALESELIKVAIEMEASVLSKTGGDTSPDKLRSEDLQVSFLSWPVADDAMLLLCLFFSPCNKCAGAVLSLSVV